jgi:ABC-type glutathione transport system ATPase component
MVCEPVNPFGWRIAGEKLAVLAALVPVLLAVLTSLEMGVKREVPRDPGPVTDTSNEVAEDDDVLCERQLVIDTAGSGDVSAVPLLGHRLRKSFVMQPEGGHPPVNGGKTVAVADFAIKLTPGECFGLLGPNGAGA